ncbi:hypothetical protein AYL99_01286 [Fonsecaea erecta]|uniref:Uncharacterized protein n=1 Tax=Fonsecaea erecta TaxID=1367422 RepID=A0A178ZZM1_9EURO|nr:hypothetical protein AYL99_01286 [Fonsecaea erecta]OAP65314.1 hypothetical protein AYL99_01286 [Fonsecaea erecta]
MGQTQSQESGSTSPPKSDPEDEDFDISQIPDDRDQASRPNSHVEPDRNLQPAFDESTSMAKRSDRKHGARALAVRQGVDKPRRESKNRRRRRRLSKNHTSDDATNGVTKRPSPPFRHSRDASPNYRPLQDTEPETYHIYAVSDSSDVDIAKRLERHLGNTTFTALNQASQKNAASMSYARPDRVHEDNLASQQAETIHTNLAAEVAVAAGTKARDGEDLSPPAIEVPQLKMNDKARFPCPLATVHNCESTFSSRKAATRHAKVHTTSFRCVVCGKQMSRKDSLDNHMKLHSAKEIASAEAFSTPNDDPQVEIPEQQESAPPKVSNDAHIQVEDGEPPEEDPIEFTTPREQPEPWDHDHNLEAEMQPDGQDELEIEMNEATPDADTADDVSDKQSTSPSSVFDEKEDIIVKDTPMPKGNLKRKRNSGDDPQRPSPERIRKRRKGSPDSPPPSVPPNELGDLISSKKSGAADVLQSRQITDKIVPRLQKRQGRVDGWAQKYTPGSNLRHPTLNPKSPPSSSVKQLLEVVVPRTGEAGSSSMKLKKKDYTLAGRERTGLHVFEGLSRKEVRNTPYTTPKGKNRAEPGVDYSTPMKESAQIEAHISESDSDSEPADIATSVAKRSFPASRAQEQDQEDNNESDLAADQHTDTDSDVSDAESAKRARRVTEAPKSERPGNGDSAECPRCHRRYANQTQLNKHLKMPSAHVHLLRCQDCSEQFWAASALAEHEKDVGHGKGTGLQGRTGAFSQAEANKLNKWRDRFCAYHNISRIQFNDMMTDTLARGKGSSWNWPFITRAEFLKEYMDVLPDRNKRSLLRYRERHFQNVEGSRNWTAEDDQDLIRLHKELGPKWAEIARRLTRTVDAVSQRWWHKLRYGEVDTGEWSKAEDVKLSQILDELRHDSTGNEVQDHRIPWNKVSERMGTRSAQQCSNHYRARHSRKERGRWVKVDALEKRPGSSRVLKPSKMVLRLSGEAPRTRTPNKGLSEKYVVDDDEDSDEGAGEGQGQADGEAAADDKLAQNALNENASSEHEFNSEADSEDEERVLRSSAEDGSPASEIPRTGIPLITKTPGKTLGSSQLFEQTQANTSALKPSQTSSLKAILQGSQERPSPNIPIQRRRLESRSPLKEIPVMENGDFVLDEEKHEEEESDSESRTNDDGESDDLDAAQQTDEEQDGTSEGSADGDDDVLAEQVVDAQAAETEDDDDDDNTNDDDSARTDEDTDEDDGNNVDEDSPREYEDDEDNEDSAMSLEKESSFMGSINESAKRARIRSSQTSIGRPVPGMGHRDRRRSHQFDQGDDSEEEQ